jgi:hypothetical protein
MFLCGTWKDGKSARVGHLVNVWLVRDIVKATLHSEDVTEEMKYQCQLRAEPPQKIKFVPTKAPRNAPIWEVTQW